MDNVLVVWPKSENIVHINYHYTQFGESIDYLKKIFGDRIFSLDQDAQNLDTCEFIKDNNIKKVIMQVNYENAKNAFEECNKIKSQNSIPVMAYGSIPIRFPNLFLDSKFDMIFKADGGDPEICMKSFINNYNEKEDTQILQEKLMGATIIRDNNFYDTMRWAIYSPR